MLPADRYLYSNIMACAKHELSTRSQRLYRCHPPQSFISGWRLLTAKTSLDHCAVSVTLCDLHLASYTERYDVDLTSIYQISHVVNTLHLRPFKPLIGGLFHFSSGQFCYVSGR